MGGCVNEGVLCGVWIPQLAPLRSFGVAIMNFWDMPYYNLPGSSVLEPAWYMPGGGLTRVKNVKKL